MNRLLALALCIAAIGCGETAESESLKEARKLHEQVMRISGDLHAAMQASLAQVEEGIEASMAQGDSVLAIQMARVESQLGELDVRFHDWEATVVGIPGDACNHDHGHDHDHDHEGHDHAHDHGSELSLEGMTDEQIREIQAALLAELQAIQTAYDAATAELAKNAAAE